MSIEQRPDSHGVGYEHAFEGALAWLQWLERHPEDQDARKAFSEWRDTSTENREAVARASRTWRALSEVSSHPVVTAWRDQVRQGRTPRRHWAAIAASGLLVAAAGYTLLAYRSDTAAMLGREQAASEEVGVRVASTALGDRAGT